MTGGSDQLQQPEKEQAWTVGENRKFDRFGKDSALTFREKRVSASMGTGPAMKVEGRQYLQHPYGAFIS